MDFRYFVAGALSGTLSAAVLLPAGGKECKEDGGKRGGSKQQAMRSRKIAQQPDAKVETFFYRQSGGFAGINKSYEVKLADVSEEQRKQLLKLIKDSGLLEISNVYKKTQGAADMFFYEFVAVDSKGEHKAAYDDGTLPERFRPLVEFVRDKLTDNRKR